MTMLDHPPNQQRSTNLSFGAALVAFVNSMLALIVVFGVGLTGAQQAEIQAVVNSFVVLAIAGAHLYSQVTNERERWSHMNGME